MIEHEMLREKIQHIFTKHKRRYGSKRIKLCLEQEDIFTSRRRIRRIMRENGLIAKGCRYNYKNYIKSHAVERPNLINHEFHTKEKNKIWFGDITYIPTVERTIYLSVFIDLYTRKCVGYSLQDHMKEGMVIDSLLDAIKKEHPKEGLIIHTDQGSEYTGSSFRELIVEKKIYTK
jgi:putative transposase